MCYPNSAEREGMSWLLWCVALSQAILPCCPFSSSSSSSFNIFIPEHKRRVTYIGDLVEQRGYPFERHNVTTKDGYILSVDRIRHGRGATETNERPVILQHGLLDCSATFLAAAEGMAYFLADRGYDVWVPNARGSLYSRAHTTLKPGKHSAYWDFSFHEMGYFDLPAVLDHIAELTGDRRVNFLGFSNGATMFLVMAATRPCHLGNLGAVVLVAPVARGRHMFMLANPTFAQINWGFFHALHGSRVGREFMGNNEVLSAFFYRQCSSSGWSATLCERWARLLARPGRKDMYDFNNAKQSFAYYPSGASAKLFIHYMQNARADRFQQFDYGKNNPGHYNGSATPPEYDLSRVTLRVHLVCGGADNIADSRDVQWLKERLPNAEMVEGGENLKYFQHRDFLHGYDLDENLYKYVFNIFQQDETQQTTRTEE